MKWYLAVLASLVVTALLFSAQLLSTGRRESGPLTTIHGIPFDTDGTVTHVTEALAHTDIFLTEPVVAKKLLLQVTFFPDDMKKLSVGVRENSFWLSYTPVVLFDRTKDIPVSGPITRTITVPLTDKIQDQNGSIDVLFFTTDLTDLASVDQKERDMTNWRLVSITAQVQPTMPTKTELKDYIRSIIKRERPL